MQGVSVDEQWGFRKAKIKMYICFSVPCAIHYLTKRLSQTIGINFTVNKIIEKYFKNPNCKRNKF